MNAHQHETDSIAAALLPYCAEETQSIALDRLMERAIDRMTAYIRNGDFVRCHQEGDLISYLLEQTRWIKADVDVAALISLGTADSEYIESEWAVQS